MEKEKRNQLITRIYNISRALIIIIFLGSLLLWATTAKAAEREDWIPTIHGTVRGKFEYQPDLSAARFEVRNARVSVDGLLPFGIADTISSNLILKRGVRYKAEIDLSAQRSRVGADSLHYVSFDAGTFYHDEHWHAEVEYLHKCYFPNQYVPVHAVDAFLAYTHTVQSRKSNRGKGLALSYLARYDYMSQQELTDAERHRLTAGLTLHMVLYRQLAADLRLNYEQYWYATDATPKESEQSKLVAELMLHF